jgi:hypothetical protein
MVTPRTRRTIVAGDRRQLDPVVLMAISGVLGGVVGFAIWMATGVFVFLPVFLAVGLVTGISIAETRRRR